MSHIAGKKVAKRHSTVIDEAKVLVKKALKLDQVSKIVTGEIKSIPHGSKRMKFIEIPAGWEIMVRGINARQKIFVYTKERKLIKDLLDKDI